LASENKVGRRREVDMKKPNIFKVLEKKIETTKIQKWDSCCWVGFYNYLEHSELKIKEWGQVNNESGGFLGLCLKAHKWKGIYWVYLQIEEENLCFKVGDVDKENRKNVREELYKILIAKAKEANRKEIKRPKPFGSGNTMTVAKVERKDWLGGDNEIVDKKKVVEKLKEYDKFLEGLIAQKG
jgi:hypothetical protein